MPIRRFQGKGRAELSFKARTLVLVADTVQKVLLVQAAQTFCAVSQFYDSHNGLSRGPTGHVGEKSRRNHSNKANCYLISSRNPMVYRGSGLVSARLGRARLRHLTKKSKVYEAYEV